jgi:hypothetical protein
VDYPGHLGRKTTPVVEILKKDPRMVVSADQPGVLAEKSIFNHDVLIMHFKTRSVAQRGSGQGQFQQFVRDGRGLVMLHFACGAFEKWPQSIWPAWCGIRRPATIPADLPRRDWDPNHPITQGMKDFQADDELYTCLVGKRPHRRGHRPVDRHQGPSHGRSPVWQRPGVSYTLGHDVKAFKCPASRN